MFIITNESPHLSEIILPCNGTHQPCKVKVVKVGNIVTKTSCVKVQHSHLACLDKHLHNKTVFELKPPIKRPHSDDEEESECAKQPRTC